MLMLMSADCQSVCRSPWTSACAWSTYNVHDSQDVALHSLTPVVLHHFGVCHHQCFHPLLSADWALMNSSPPSPLATFPALSLSLSVINTNRIWRWMKSKQEIKKKKMWFLLFVHISQPHFLGLRPKPTHFSTSFIFPLFLSKYQMDVEDVLSVSLDSPPVILLSITGWDVVFKV